MLIDGIAEYMCSFSSVEIGSATSGRHGDGRLHHTGDHHTGDAACSTDGAGGRGSGMLIEITLPEGMATAVSITVDAACGTDGAGGAIWPCSSMALTVRLWHGRGIGLR